MNKRLWWFKFRTDLWNEVPRGWSFELRGFLVEVMALMSRDVRRGYLTIDGQPMTPEQLGRKLGCTADFATTCLEEAVTAQFFLRRGPHIFSPWVLADEEERKRKQSAGRARAIQIQQTVSTNPAEPQQKSSRVLSISSSVSDSGVNSIEKNTEEIPRACDTPDHQPDDNGLPETLLEAVRSFMGVRFIPRVVEFKLADCVALTSTQAVLDAIYAAMTEKPKPSITNVLARTKTVEGFRGGEAGWRKPRHKLRVEDLAGHVPEQDERRPLGEVF